VTWKVDDLGAPAIIRKDAEGLPDHHIDYGTIDYHTDESNHESNHRLEKILEARKNTLR
jgi:hypothetical protein